MPATLDLAPVGGTFGAVVNGIDVRCLDEPTWQAIHFAWIEYALLIFPAQFLTREEQDGFARRFGPLEFTATATTNLTPDGAVIENADSYQLRGLRANEGWHHDSSYMPVQAKGAVFSAEIIPMRGGATGFADMRAAYETLDDATRDRLRGLSAYHSIVHSQARAGALPKQNADGGYDEYGFHGGEPPLRPLVKHHPSTGRPNLVLGRHAYLIEGMDQHDSERLLDELTEWACQAPRVHYHQWAVGDTVVWDNRRLMHRATPFDMTEPRRMCHTRIAGDPETDRGINLDAS